MKKRKVVNSSKAVRRYERRGFIQAKKIAIKEIESWFELYKQMYLKSGDGKLELARSFAAQDILEAVKGVLK